jgi:acetone carboxylase gamma subunit
MFTNSCFIRKNTPELREKLKYLGYDISSIKESSECIATSYVNEKAVGISEDSFDDTNPHHTWNCAGRIDCSDNEKLFLALAALQDDTDIDQWFVYPKEDKWFICDYSDIELKETLLLLECHVRLHGFIKAIRLQSVNLLNIFRNSYESI